MTALLEVLLLWVKENAIDAKIAQEDNLLSVVDANALQARDMSTEHARFNASQVNCWSTEDAKLNAQQARDLSMVNAKFNALEDSLPSMADANAHLDRSMLTDTVKLFLFALVVNSLSTVDANALQAKTLSMANAKLYAQQVSLLSTVDANAHLELDWSMAHARFTVPEVNTWSMEDVRLEEPVFATKPSMKETTDVLIVNLEDWETPQQANVLELLLTAMPEENFN